MVLANKIFQLLDLFTLLLEGASLDFQAFGLLSNIGRIVTAKVIEFGIDQFPDFAGDLIEKKPVVADEQERAWPARESCLEPFSRLDIEVIVRLVENHQLGLFEQQVRQHQSVLLATTERLRGAIEPGLGESQALQGAFDAVLPAVRITVLQSSLQVVEMFKQPFMFARLRALRKLMRDIFGFFGQGNDVSNRFGRHAPQRIGGGKRGMLLQIADRGRSVGRDAATVGGLLASQDAQQRRLAGTVGTH